MHSLRNVFGSLWLAIGHVRVWATAWLLVTVPALIAVWPAYQEYEASLSQHPGASFHLDQALDADLARTRPELVVSLVGGIAFALLAGAFLTGGILACVGRRDRRFRYGEFLVEGARLFLRNLRVLVLGAILALLVFWGVDSLDTWLRHDLLYGVDPGATAVPLLVFDVRWLHLFELLDLLWGFLFVGLLYASKVAMAHLCWHDRRSALRAWLVAAGRILRHPLRALASIVLLLGLWLGGAHVFGELTVRVLEVRQDLVLGAVAGQLGVVWLQWVFVAIVLSARRFAEPSARVVDLDEGPVAKAPAPQKPDRPVPSERPAPAKPRSAKAARPAPGRARPRASGEGKS